MEIGLSPEKAFVEVLFLFFLFFRDGHGLKEETKDAFECFLPRQETLTASYDARELPPLEVR